MASSKDTSSIPDSLGKGSAPVECNDQLTGDRTASHRLNECREPEKETHPNAKVLLSEGMSCNEKPSANVCDSDAQPLISTSSFRSIHPGRLQQCELNDLPERDLLLLPTAQPGSC